MNPVNMFAEAAVALVGAVLLAAGVAAVLTLLGVEVPMLAVIIGSVCGLAGGLFGLYAKDVLQNF